MNNPDTAATDQSSLPYPDRRYAWFVVFVLILPPAAFIAQVVAIASTR